MPVNLLKLPSLVGLMIVTELEYQEIFLLSICSCRSTSLVKKAKITAAKLTFGFGKCEGEEGFLIGAVNAMSEWSYVTAVKHVPELNSEEVPMVESGLDDESTPQHNDTPTLKTTEIQLDYKEIIESWYHLDDSSKEVRFRHQIESVNEPMAVQKSVQDHINSIFHYTGPYKLLLSMECEGRLPNITNVKHIAIDDGAIDTQLLTNILSTYPDPHTIESSIVEELPKDSPLFQIQNIAVNSRCETDYFQNFGGRNIFLECVTITEQDLIQFIHKWISNEKYHNLETLIICVEHPLSINADVIRQAIEFDEYDPNEPEKRPENYVCNTPFDGILAREEIPLRNADVAEIKRIEDGKIAYFSIFPERFEFLVHKN
ncbi:unnamed protein product [Caenorhabditis nigoni]